MTLNNTTLANVVYPVANAGVSTNPFVDAFHPRDPNGNDINYPIQKKWLNTAAGSFWMLEGFTSLGSVVQALWIKIGSVLLTETLTGNTGGPVPPTANNINVVGDGTTITTAGNPATSTLTISVAGGVATTYDCNTGSAAPSGGILNVLGGSDCTTVGSGNTITINVSGSSLAANYTNVTHAMSPYTVLVTDYYLSVDCSGGIVTLNFPNAPTFKQVWVVKDRTGSSATNNISITTPGGTVTFDGQTTYTINTNYEALNLLANATPTYEVF
jgi:hypothetical protein